MPSDTPMVRRDLLQIPASPPFLSPSTWALQAPAIFPFCQLQGTFCHLLPLLSLLHLLLLTWTLLSFCKLLGPCKARYTATVVFGLLHMMKKLQVAEAKLISSPELFAWLQDAQNHKNHVLIKNCLALAAGFCRVCSIGATGSTENVCQKIHSLSRDRRENFYFW